MRKTLSLLFTFIFLTFIQAYSQQSKSKIILKPFATGVTNPVDIQNAGDGRLFVVEKAGRIVIVDSAGKLMPNAFLDISKNVVSTGTEQGLLGVAFQPDSLRSKTGNSKRKYFFVNYTGKGDSTHISRFMIDSMNANRADTHEVKIMTIYQPFNNHNGGHLTFGPDSFLYIGLGDGGSAGDPQNRAQDSTSLLGKILRINVNVDTSKQDSANKGRMYSIPSTNPLFKDTAAKDSAVRKEIFALGFRNPWSLSFDSTGILWIADVGQNKFEEINILPDTVRTLRNYGWRCFEGDSMYDTTNTCKGLKNLTNPVFVYGHTDSACSIIGGYRYHGAKVKNLSGKYLFADYCNGMLWALQNNGEPGSWDTISLGKFNNYTFSSFGQDSKGELYIANLKNGTIYQITSSDTTKIGIEDAILSSIIYPNPFTESINIEIDDPNDQATLTLFDLEGKMIYEQVLKNKSEKINLSFLKPGMYLLHLQTNKSSKIEKVVKM